MSKAGSRNRTKLDLGTPFITRVQDAVLRLPFSIVILLWISIYFFIGILFFFVYDMHLDWLKGASPATWQDALSYSFVTQATIGYGDFAPARWWRLFANAQAIIGTGLNGAALGLITFRILRRENPIRASDFASLQLLPGGDFSFRLRYISVDTHDLVDVTANLFFVTNARHRNSRYDTYAGCVREMKLVTVLPMSIFALDVPVAAKTISLGGDDVEAAHNDRMIDIHPSMFIINEQVDRDARLLLRIRGNHGSTGEIFSFSLDYYAKDIRCQHFDPIDNNALARLSVSERRKIALMKLNRFTGSPRVRCTACLEIARCPFGGADNGHN